jgi:copper chaperone CopZ
MTLQYTLLRVEGMCSTCVRSIESALRLDGLRAVDVRPDEREVFVAHDARRLTTNQLAGVLHAAGFVSDDRLSVRGAAAPQPTVAS